MKLAGELYQVLESKIDSDQLEFRIEFDPSHIIYEGHFPGHALTPGVIQLAIIEEICATHIRKELRLKKVYKCKFLNMIDPTKNPIVTISIQIELQEEVAIVSATISEEEISFFEMKVEFESL